MKTFSEARKMYDGGRAAKTGWDCGDCGAEKNRSDQCRSCGSPARYHRDVQKEGYFKSIATKNAEKQRLSLLKKSKENIKRTTTTAKTKLGEDLASGRPAKKPVSSNLLKQRAKENEKALASGFMKLTPKERAKESKRLSEDYSDHKKNKYELYSDDKTGHPDKKAHDDIHKAVTHKSGELKHVDAAMKKHEKHGASDTASREAIHKHFTKHHADKKGKTWNFAEENMSEMVSGFRKGNETVSKKGTLHKSPHITPDRDGGKVADALNKHSRLKTIKKAHKKLSEGGVGGLVPLSKAKEAVKDMEKSMGLKKTKDSGIVKTKGGYSRKTTYTRESAVNEAKKPVVHFKGKDSLKMVKIKYNKPIKTKVTDIGPGGKETVRKDWSEENLQELSPKTISSYQKKAGAQYRQLRKDGPTKRQDVENAYHQGYTSDKEYDKQHDNISKMKKRGRGLAASKGKGLKEEQRRVVESLGKLMSRGLDNVKKFQDSDTAKQIRQKKTTAGVKPAVSQKKR